MTMSSTNDLTTAANATPRMNATAISSRLPWIANALKSFSRPRTSPPFVDDPAALRRGRHGSCRTLGRAVRRDRAPPPSVSRPRLHSPVRASCTRDEIACGSGSQREVWAHPDRDTNPAPMQSRGRTTRPSLASAAVTAGPTIGFVHTVLSLPPTFASLAQELVPDAEVFHIVDETLLGVTRRAGELTPVTRRRVLGYVESAADAGADLVVVTCSSIGPAGDASRGLVGVPVLRVDEAI